MPDSAASPEGSDLKLSHFAEAFLDSIASIKIKQPSPEEECINVSQTVSFFAILYERVRNAMEFREEHLVRRAAIERILNRRLMLNPQGKGEAENLVRELLWARYLNNNTLMEHDVTHLQSIIDKYAYLKRVVVQGRSQNEVIKLSDFINDLLTCEIEEELNPALAQRRSSYLYFFYQVLNTKIQIKGVQKTDTDAYFYVASEIAYAKNDRPYVRYHLFQLLHASLHTLDKMQVEELSHQFTDTVTRINKTIKNPYNEKLVKFAKKHTASFLILFSIADKYPQHLQTILQNKKELWYKIDTTCRQKYQQTGIKLRTAAIRSVIYIFLTKAIFALILEFPLSQYFFGEVHMPALVTNTVFPPLLMGLLVSFVHVPGDQNTRMIYERVTDILTRDHALNTARTQISTKVNVRRPILLLGFTFFYLLTFAVTFMLIYYALDFFKFNIISKAIFVFFVSLVAFFGYRVRQIAKEYTVAKPGNIFSPIIDFFFIPVLFLGKFLSREIAKLNVLLLVFDFLIEAPFKLISEIVEEWINFVKARKEEIV